MDEWEDKLGNVSSDNMMLDLSGDQADSDRRTQAKVTAFASNEVVELAKLGRPAIAGFALASHDLFAARAAVEKLNLDPDSARNKLRGELDKFNETAEPIYETLEAVRADIHVQIRSELQSKQDATSIRPINAG